MKRAARRLLALLLIAVLPMQALAALAGVGCPWRGGTAAGAAHADIHAHAAVQVHDVATDPLAVAGSAVHGPSADAALASPDSPDSPASCHGTDGFTHAANGGAGCAGCSIVAATIPSAPRVDTGALAQAYAPFVPDPPPAARPERLERPQRGRPA